MVDLKGQYLKIKNEIDKNIISSINSGRFVNGPIVNDFSENLSEMMGLNKVFYFGLICHFYLILLEFRYHQDK